MTRELTESQLIDKCMHAVLSLKLLPKQNDDKKLHWCYMTERFLIKQSSCRVEYSFNVENHKMILFFSKIQLKVLFTENKLICVKKIFSFMSF